MCYLYIYYIQSYKYMTEKTIPLFRIKPLDATRAIIKYKGSIAEDEKIIDEVIDVDNKNIMSLKQIDKYEITGCIFKCNIVGSHIVASTKYPVVYVDIYYEKPMVSGSLFQLMYTIIMDAKEKKQISGHNKYVNLHFNGSWMRHIECDVELQTNYNDLLTDMLELEAIDKLYSSDDLAHIRESSEEINWINNYIIEEKKEYDLIITSRPYTFKSINTIRDEIATLCSSDRFHKFIKIALLCRDENRRKKYGVKNEKYDRPNVSLYIDKIKQEMIDNDELIN
jgi:hypothetical protein